MILFFLALSACWLQFSASITHSVHLASIMSSPYTMGRSDVNADMDKYFLTKDALISGQGGRLSPQVNSALVRKVPPPKPSKDIKDNRPAWMRQLPKVNFRCDPLINFKLKQQLRLLGASITLGLDYLTDISQWRSYCQIEDAWLRGRFSLRGSELGWAKSWLFNFGLGEQNSAMIKLRLGLNMKTQRLYAKLRFRTEPMSPFDIGDGLSCAGRLPLPMYLLPSFTRSLPLRVEYRVRINTSRGPQHHHYERTQQSKRGHRIMGHNSSPQRVVSMSTGLGAVDVSLDELNFCLEWDETSPVWGIGLVRNDPSRKRLPPVFVNNKASSSLPGGKSSVADGGTNGLKRGSFTSKPNSRGSDFVGGGSAPGVGPPQARDRIRTPTAPRVPTSASPSASASFS